MAEVARPTFLLCGASGGAGNGSQLFSVLLPSCLLSVTKKNENAADPAGAVEAFGVSHMELSVDARVHALENVNPHYFLVAYFSTSNKETTYGKTDAGRMQLAFLRGIHECTMIL